MEHWATLATPSEASPDVAKALWAALALSQAGSLHSGPVAHSDIFAPSHSGNLVTWRKIDPSRPTKASAVALTIPDALNRSS